MNNKLFKQISETKYLSTENAWRYRAIMRLFFVHNQRYKHWLKKEDVYYELIKDIHFEDYTMDMCKQDLDALTEWGNLSTKQDTSKVATYQQFVNKQFNYQMTEYAIEIERMTIRLENLFIEGGSLEPTLLERIKDEINKLPSFLNKDSKEVGGWWQQLTNDFQRLNQNYQDYIRDWNSLKADEMMKTKNFLLYKEKLVDYLRHFIKELQLHAIEIESSLKAFEGKDIEGIFEKVTDYELSIPRLEMDQLTREMIYDNVQGKYHSIQSFFIPMKGRESEVDQILSMTNEIIRKITRYAVNLLEISSQYSSRRAEYLKIAEMFHGTGEMESAHKLSSQVFGIKSCRHIVGDVVRETDSINSSVHDEKPIEIVITPRVRTYREKIGKTAIIDHKAEKAEMLKRVLAERAHEEAILQEYLKTDRVDFSKLDHLPETVRRTILRWLGKGLLERGGYAMTEQGRRFRVANPEETQMCTIECEDGRIQLLAYILEFEER